MALAWPVLALDLAQCERTTHISHGGETGHRDFGAGRVGYAEWWSQEGTSLDLVVADCRTGQFLRSRTQEDNIKPRPPFDRTNKAVGIIENELTASPALFSFDRLATALKGTGRDTLIGKLDTEPCACAALYPDARDDWTKFEDAQ